MRIAFLVIIVLIGINTSAQFKLGWEAGVNMTHHDFTQDLGNNYNQHIGIQGSSFIRYSILEYLHINLKYQVANERVSLGSRFPNQQIYFRSIPTLEYDVTDKISFYTGINLGFKLLEYSFDFYGRNRRYDTFFLKENRTNLALQFGTKYTKGSAFIYANANFELVSNLDRNLRMFDPNNLANNGGHIVVGLGYYLKKDLFEILDLRK